jgi:metal-sulfur cluster biosynthetic enzyme
VSGLTEAQVLAALAEVQDPELPVGIVDLGLVRSVAVDGDAVRVGIAFTSIACPCTDVLLEDVFEPWSRDHLTEEGRLALRALGVV